MFDNEPSYLGGLTTQLQDSMQGIQYGRSDINPDGRYVPNNSAKGTVYREMPKKGKAKIVPNEQDFARQRANEEQAKSGDPLAVVQMHVDRLSNDSKPTEFFGLTMPSGLVDSTPQINTWISSLEQLEEALQQNVPLSDQLKNPNLSVARLALEFIQPGTARMDSPSQIQRTQQLLKHLRDQAQKDPNIAPAPKKTTFTNVIVKSTSWARDNIKHPRTRVGQFSVPQFLIKQDKTGMFTEQSLNALFNALKSQLATGEELSIPEESLKVIIPIVAFSNGSYPQNIQQLQYMVNKMATLRPTSTVKPTQNSVMTRTPEMKRTQVMTPTPRPQPSQPRSQNMPAYVPNKPYTVQQVAPLNTAINMPANNNEMNSNIPAYMNTNASANAPANVSNYMNTVPNSNVNYPQNNVNVPNAIVEPSLVNKATEFVSKPTGMLATAAAVGIAIYLFSQRK